MNQFYRNINAMPMSFCSNVTAIHALQPQAHHATSFIKPSPNLKRRSMTLLTRPKVLDMPHRVNETSPTTLASQAVEAVRFAIAAGDLPSVEEAFSGYLNSDSGNPFKKDNFVFGLANAIEASQPSILSYLLSQGVPYHTVHVKLAIAKNAEDALEVFLAYGWKINEPENWSTPPLLR